MSDLKSVVAGLRDITVELRAPGRSGGSGVIWRADGLVVTSAHVVEAARRGEGSAEIVLGDKRRLPAALLEWDRRLDLAVLRVEATRLPAAMLGDSARIRPGELVLAVGTPFGLAGAVTTGIVHSAPRGGGAWIEADLRLSPGNSGGPLADARGRVIGIVSMIAGRLALSVPSHVVQDFVVRSAGP